MQGFKETIDQLAMASSVCWHGHSLRRGWSLDFEVDGQRKKGQPKRTWKKQVLEERMKVGLRRKDALCCSYCRWSVGINKIAAGLR